MSDKEIIKEKNVKEDTTVQEKKDTTDTRDKKNKQYINIMNNNGGIDRVEYHPAPRHNASDSMTRLSIRAREHATSKEKHELPSSARDNAFNNTSWQPLGSGLASLADNRWPEDVNDVEAMDMHIYDLLTLNRDIIRTDNDIPSPSTLVRVPN